MYIGRQLSSLAEMKVRPFIKSDPMVRRGTETILLADGDVLIRQVDRLVLEELGYKVLVAKTANSAISKYKARFGKRYLDIELIITDLELPGMDGSELIDELKRINPEVKVLLSGKSQPEDETTSSLLKNTKGFIQKPFDIIDVSSILKEALDEY